MKYWTDEQRMKLIQAKDMDEVRKLQERGVFPPQKLESLRRTRAYLAGYYKKHGRLPLHRRIEGIQTNLSPKEQLEYERDIRGRREQERSERKTYDAALQRIDELEHELSSYLQISRATPHEFKIHPRETERSEATAVICASDWHIEEKVERGWSSGMNYFDLDVAKKRVEKFWQNSLRLLQIHERDSLLQNVVLFLGGDFITGNIHDENLEICQLRPVPAAILAGDMIRSGIEFLLNHTKCDFVVPCVVGNHSRITKKIRSATERDNSLELFIYDSLAKHFASEKRIKFVIQDGYHIYMDIYESKLRFHHGHKGWKYMGGVGGLAVPANRVIKDWNITRQVDVDVFGHYHQMWRAPRFIANGSLIGFNGYAVDIGAQYEPPRQTFFLVSKKRGVGGVIPIFLE